MGIQISEEEGGGGGSGGSASNNLKNITLDNLVTLKNHGFLF